MIIKHASHPRDVKQFDTARLREEFLTEQLFIEDQIQVVYSHIDRIVAIGVSPITQVLKLADFIDNQAFGTDFFLQRRELGIVNLGGKALVESDNEQYTLGHLDAAYLAKGEKNIRFTSLNPENPALLYCLSAPAHQQFSSRKISLDDAIKIELGSQDTANERVINQYIHPDVLDTCQLCMGVTHLQPGSVWNTMPAHTHERRMEAYLYFNIQPSQVVFHMMGEPQETRHLVVNNRQLVLSPSWSIHSGCGTKDYSFVWGMVGENQTFDDMDFVETSQLR
ncbi:MULTISPECIES: 5-dehydro-4-deoxy-D-glucuronate isomerase [unclassified Agarivorans]|uniref:5-dehydro-4-deoxy-D-glucuronate isomerase n=1 Tax=unclassified Agarivorans TaxID=2636026 RepID=UPI003D7E4657